MTAFKEPDRKTLKWRFQFWYKRTRYRSPRGFRTKELCEQAERALRDRLVRLDYGIPEPAGAGPTFTRWAGVVYDYAVHREHLRDPGSLDINLRKILRFWGHAPHDASKRIPGAPYHGLTLDAPIRDGAWLLKFEEWMTAEGMAGSTKNHCRSACSKLYRVALLAEYRVQTGITANPFRGILRDPPVRRDVVFTPEQLQAVLQAAPTYLRTAMRIAALAPELRISNIAALRWSHLDAHLKWIRLADHKTARMTQKPLVTPVVPQLRRYLLDVRARQPEGCEAVVDRNGEPVSRFVLKDELERACAEAGVLYGKKHGGVTFHTIRHTAITTMAEIGIPDNQRQQAVGHSALATTAGYTHMTPRHKIDPLTKLAREIEPSLRTKTKTKRQRARHRRLTIG